MSYPKNPETIVLKNKFYPKGLKERDIYEYYMKVKSKLLDEVKQRDLMFVIYLEGEKPIVKKNHKGRPIQLTSGNYDELITGRTLSIHSTMNHMERIGIVDIDADDWNMAKRSTMEIYDETLKAPFVSDVQIRYTGKTSFHLMCNLPRKGRVDSIRYLFENFYRKSKLSRKYTIQKSREKGIPNIDLFRNVKGANFITLYALSVWGLKCMELDYREIRSFSIRQSTI